MLVAFWPAKVVAASRSMLEKMEVPKTASDSSRCTPLVVVVLATVRLGFLALPSEHSQEHGVGYLPGRDLAPRVLCV